MTAAFFDPSALRPVRTIHTRKLSPWRAGAGLCSFARLVKRPEELDNVVRMSEQLADPAIVQDVVDAISEDPGVARALGVRARLGHVPVGRLARLPEGTLGRTYADFLTDNGLDPNDLPVMAADSDGDYLRAHLYETHDLWHVLTGFGTDVASELGLQAFYLAQLPSPMSIVLMAGGLLNAAVFEMEDAPNRMDEITLGWQIGRSASSIVGIDFASLWEEPLDELRAAYGVVPVSAASSLASAAT